MIQAKLIFSLILVIFFLSLLRINFSNQLRIKEKLVLIFLFPIAFLIIFNPNLLDQLALLFEVERGRDLLFYFFMLISSWGLVRNHIRINKLSSNINKLVSKLAIYEFNSQNRKKFKD